MSDYFKPRWLRNQMEESLWQYLRDLPNWGNTAEGARVVPTVFKSRIKKLLSLDRTQGSETELWVFFDHAGGGTGTQESYSDFHVFLMGIALQMLNIGFKQSEVIFFLQHTQNYIKQAYSALRSSDKVAPVSGTNRNIMKNAIQYFMLINRVEITETREAEDHKKPFIFAPVFIAGVENLQKELSKRTLDYMAFIVIELADAALTIHKILPEIPAARRGRPSK